MQSKRFIITLVSLIVSISAGRTIIDLWRRQDVLKSREKELTSLREENKAFERTLRDVGSESYVERTARDELGMVKEGETIVIIENPKTNSKNPELKDTISNWRRWWGLFF